MAKPTTEETIMAQWKQFALTEAYRDWETSMNQLVEMLQNDVDNLTESRPELIDGKVVTSKVPITLEKAGILNQRKVGIKYALEYAKLRIEE